MKQRMIIPVILAVVALCVACEASNTSSDVGKWWYTEVPQGYTEQGTAVNPVGSPLPTVGGNNSNPTTSTNTGTSSGKR